MPSDEQRSFDRDLATDKWVRDFMELLQEDAKLAKEGAPMVITTTPGHGVPLAFYPVHQIGKSAYCRKIQSEWTKEPE